MMEMREGGWKCLLEKGGGKAKWESLSRNGEGGGGGLPCYIKVFLEIPHDAA